MRRFLLISLLLLTSLPLMLAPVQAQTITEHHFTLYIEDFTNVEATAPADLQPPITFSPNRANFFTHSDANIDWITLQIGYTVPAELTAGGVGLAMALKNEVLTADGNLGYVPETGYTSWRTLATGAPNNSRGANNLPAIEDAKVEILIEPHKLLGETSRFTVADIADIRWQTYRLNTGGGNDWYASIWVNMNEVSTISPGRSIGLINFEGRYTAPPLTTGDGMQNSAQGLGASEHFWAVTQINGTNGPRLQDFRDAPINWTNYPNSSNNITVDYRNRDVAAIAFATASDWGHSLDSYLDDLQIDIEDSSGNIDRIIINLETRAPVYSSTPTEDSTINLTTHVGVQAIEPARIENIGTAQLVINSATLLGPDTPIVGVDTAIAVNLQPNEGIDYNFICGGPAYITPGIYTNTLHVIHNGLGEPSPAEYKINCEITSDFTVDNAQSTSGALVNGATFTAEQEEVNITFTANVFNTTDPADPNYADSASNPANYVLLQGDSIITNACNAINPSDTRITAFTVNYDPATFTSTLTFNPALSDGSYRLLVCGTTSIVLNLIPTVSLNGGNDVVFNFTVDTTVPITPTPIPLPTNTGTGAGTGTGTPTQPEDLGVAQLPATGEAPTWADFIRRVLGW